MLAQWCFTAWNIAIGRPNCWRTLAYAVAVSTHSCAPPAASARDERPRDMLRERTAPRQHAHRLDAVTPRGRHDPTRRVGSRLPATVTSSPAASRSSTTMSSPARAGTGRRARRRARAPPSPVERPSPSRCKRAIEPERRAGVPSARAGKQLRPLRVGPAAAITVDAITVGRNGPGATARPSSWSTTTSSGRP